MYIILVLLALLILAAVLILAWTRRRLDEMDGVGKVRETDEDGDDSVIGHFGE